MAAGSGEHDNESPIKIGSTVYFVTCFDEKIQGEIMCFDDTTKLMAISILCLSAVVAVARIVAKQALARLQSECQY